MDRPNDSLRWKRNGRGRCRSSSVGSTSIPRRLLHALPPPPPPPNPRRSLPPPNPRPSPRNPRRSPPPLARNRPSSPRSPSALNCLPLTSSPPRSCSAGSRGALWRRSWRWLIVLLRHERRRRGGRREGRRTCGGRCRCRGLSRSRGRRGRRSSLRQGWGRRWRGCSKGRKWGAKGWEWCGGRGSGRVVCSRRFV